MYWVAERENVRQRSDLPVTMALLEGVALGLQARRLTALATQDEITRPLREHISQMATPESSLSYLVTCRKCSSVWASATVLSLHALSTANLPVLSSLCRNLSYILSLSEVVILTDRLLAAVAPEFD